jgi:hypothetical protein
MKILIPNRRKKIEVSLNARSKLMGLWNQSIVGLDETQELIQKEMTKRHIATVERDRYRAELKYLAHQVNAQKEVLLFLANIHYAQKQFISGHAVSLQQQLMQQAYILIQEGIKSENIKMIEQGRKMMTSATEQATGMAKDLGASEFSLPSLPGLTFGQQPKVIPPVSPPFNPYSSNW